MNWPHPFRCLAHKNLRLFFGGQCVSLVGTWMQSVAQGWLVYRLTRSSELLGLMTFLSQLPVFLFGVYAGSVADRFPRRKVVLITQLNAVIQATLLAVVTLSHAVQPWHLLALSALLGMTYAFEIPARQSLLADIAGEDMPNAIALNSSIVNIARVLGPALAGYVVAAVGEGWCFALNAVSFAGTLYALWVMKVPPRPVTETPSRNHLRDGLAYAARTSMVRGLLGLLAVSSFFGMPYSTLLPVFAGEVLGGGPALLGTLHACAGAGAFFGAASLLSRRGINGLGRWVALGASALGVGLVGLSLSRSALLSEGFLVLAGLGFIGQMAGTMTLLQSLAPADMRGRLMGLFSTLFVGVTPFGALAAGAIAHRIGAPATVLGGSLVTLAASLAFHLALPGLRRSALEQHPALVQNEAP